MVLRLTLIAHGATSATRRAAFPSDEELEERAIRKAAALKPKLGRVDCVLTSPARCARQTADGLGLEAEADYDLRECDYGRWRGLSLGELAAADPGGLALWLSDPESAPHGGESLAALLPRVGGWLDRQIASGAKRQIAVTHASVIRAAILRVLAAPAPSFWRIDIAPLSRTVLIANEARWTLRSMNTGPED
jgi:broad specificity phosphatase PhoE